ncbi:MAG: hypothetical protein IMZ57_11150 [Acidobacteria bacterium]|nr:hypothetical protein [Acidobacteriota bacterium]
MIGCKEPIERRSDREERLEFSTTMIKVGICGVEIPERERRPRPFRSRDNIRLLNIPRIKQSPKSEDEIRRGDLREAGAQSVMLDDGDEISEPLDRSADADPVRRIMAIVEPVCNDRYFLHFV